MKCVKCPLGTRRGLRTNCMPSNWWPATKCIDYEGTHHPDLLVVGEAPGEQEDREGKPFVGKSGQFLRDSIRIMCEKMGAAPHIAYTNVIRCRPPANRDPLVEEIEACQEHLVKEVGALQPRLIACFGRVAANAVIRGTTRTGKGQSLVMLSTDIGKVFWRPIDPSGLDVKEIEVVPIMTCYHPAAVLRNPRLKLRYFEGLEQIITKVKELKNGNDLEV